MDADFLSDYLLEAEVAKILGVTVRTLRGWRQRRIGPPWCKPTKDLVIYRKPGFRDWLKAGEVQPISHGDKAA